MPMHPVTSTLMYRGICTIPDILSYSAPVNLPEDEVEGEMPFFFVLFFFWCCAPVGVRAGVFSSQSVPVAAGFVCLWSPPGCAAHSNRRAVSTLDSAHDADLNFPA